MHELENSGIREHRNWRTLRKSRIQELENPDSSFQEVRAPRNSRTEAVQKRCDTLYGFVVSSMGAVVVAGGRIDEVSRPCSSCKKEEN